MKDSLWRGESYLPGISEAIDPTVDLSQSVYPVTTIVLAALIAIVVILGLLFSKKISRWISGLLPSISNSDKRENAGSFRFSLRLIVICFFLPVVSVMLTILYKDMVAPCKDIVIPWIIPVFLFAALIVKKIVLETISWITGDKFFSHKTEEAMLISVSLLGLFGVISMPIYLLSDSITESMSNIYLIVAFSVSFFLFIILFMIQIFKGKFSIFWGFLYLCTLEVLPICVIASIFA